MSTLSPKSASTPSSNSNQNKGATAPPSAPVETRVEGVDGHYNRITKRWEALDDQQYVVSSVQNGSTFPEEIGYVAPKSSLKDTLFKKFGKSSNKNELPHTRNQSDTLLNN